MGVDTVTLTVYRFISPKMATRNWFSTCTSQAIVVADNGHRWTRLTMHSVQQCLSISVITSLLSPILAIDRYLPQSIVTDNMYRYIYSQSINPQWLSMDLPQSIVAGSSHRSISRTIQCGWQWPSVDAVDDLCSSTMCIGRKYQPSIVANNICRWIPSTICCRRRYLSICCPRRPC